MIWAEQITSVTEKNCLNQLTQGSMLWNRNIFNRYRRKRPKVDAGIFDSALSHTRRSDTSEKRDENSVSTFGRFRLCTTFASSPVSVNNKFIFRLKF